MNKRQLFVLFLGRAITALAALCCFFPFVKEGIAAYEGRAVREYAGTSSAFSDSYQKSVDETMAIWKQRLETDTELTAVGSFKINRIDLIRRLRKMPIEYSYCPMCESDFATLQRESAAKISEVNRLYEVYRQRMVGLHGEAAVADEEVRNQSMDTQVDPKTWDQLLVLLLQCYLLSCLTRIPFLALKAHLNGFSVLYELITPDRIILVALLYPVAEVGYPWGTPIQNIKRVLSYAVWFIMSCVSWGVGGASAQTPGSTKSPSGKAGSGYIFTMDTREEVEVVDGDGKTTTLRVMVAKDGRKAFFEAFAFGKTSSGGQTESLLVTPGVNLFRKKLGDTKLTLNAIGGIRLLRSENAAGVVTHQTRIATGLEFFALSKYFQFFNPAARLEIEPRAKGSKTLLYTAQLLGRASPGKRFWAGVEGSATHTFGRPTSGYFGVVGAFDPKPGKSRLEIAVIKALLPTGNGAHSIRGRFIYNFAF